MHRLFARSIPEFIATWARARRFVDWRAFKIFTGVKNHLADGRLTKLEARIGRFNIFDALGIARAEIRHSSFLAFILDPAESHGQGQLFLKAASRPNR